MLPPKEEVERAIEILHDLSRSLQLHSMGFDEIESKRTQLRITAVLNAIELAQAYCDGKLVPKQFEIDKDLMEACKASQDGRLKKAIGKQVSIERCQKKDCECGGDAIISKQVSQDEDLTAAYLKGVEKGKDSKKVSQVSEGELAVIISTTLQEDIRNKKKLSETIKRLSKALAEKMRGINGKD